jgi:uroporphyrinogen-III synthase
MGEMQAQMEAFTKFVRSEMARSFNAGDERKFRNAIVRTSPPRVIAIGPQTANELRLFGIEPEILPGFYSRDFVPYLGKWIQGKRIGIPRADVPNPGLIAAIKDAGGVVLEFRCYSLEPTGEILSLEDADAVLFTSAMSYVKAVWKPRTNLLVMAIGDITATAMRSGGTEPGVVGDGSLEGTLRALNKYLTER